MSIRVRSASSRLPQCLFVHAMVDSIHKIFLLSQTSPAKSPTSFSVYPPSLPSAKYSFSLTINSLSSILSCPRFPLLRFQLILLIYTFVFKSLLFLLPITNLFIFFLILALVLRPFLSSVYYNYSPLTTAHYRLPPILQDSFLSLPPTTFHSIYFFIQILQLPFCIHLDRFYSFIPVFPQSFFFFHLLLSSTFFSEFPVTDY